MAGNEFNRNHKFVFLDERIALGGLDGYSIFNSKDFNAKKSSLPVLIQITYIFINEPQMNVEFIATHIAKSRSSHNRKLKNILEISTSDMIKRYRLQKAKKLLVSGEDIMSTVYKIGFNTPSYFTHCFKEQ